VQDLQWSDIVDASMLAWEENGQAHTLSSYKFGLSRDDMIRIADSLR
jgi:hypothetical protein